MAHSFFFQCGSGVAGPNLSRPDYRAVPTAESALSEALVFRRKTFALLLQERRPTHDHIERRGLVLPRVYKQEETLAVGRPLPAVAAARISRLNRRFKEAPRARRSRKLAAGGDTEMLESVCERSSEHWAGSLSD